MSRAILLRIVVGLVLLFGVYIFPYWLVVIAAAIVAGFIPFYVEFIALVVIEEALYHTTGAGLWYPVVLFACFVILELVRTLTRERFLRI